jgi:hypothetical protein
MHETVMTDEQWLHRLARELAGSDQAVSFHPLWHGLHRRPSIWQSHRWNRQDYGALFLVNEGVIEFTESGCRHTISSGMGAILSQSCPPAARFPTGTRYHEVWFRLPVSPAEKRLITMTDAGESAWLFERIDTLLSSGEAASQR